MAIPAISGEERVEEDPGTCDPWTLSCGDEGLELEEEKLLLLLDCVTDEDDKLWEVAKDDDDDAEIAGEDGLIVGKENIGRILEKDDVNWVIPLDEAVATSWKNVMGPVVATMPLLPCILR